jgi:hypothetical protein
MWLLRIPGSFIAQFAAGGQQASSSARAEDRIVFVGIT